MTQQVDQILNDLRAVRQSVSPASPSVDNAIALWSGVDDIAKRIDVTKTEIGALHAFSQSDQSGTRAAEELRAVVVGTETATDAILAAAETIDALLPTIERGADGTVRNHVGTIAGSVVQIFEACNFQDITGQRISKVVESLQFIEQRIATMVDIWRAQEFAAPTPHDRTDRDLLNGPALEGDHGIVDQDEVDALFR